MTDRKNNAARYEQLINAFRDPVSSVNDLFYYVDALTPSAFTQKSLPHVNQTLVELQRQLLVKDNESEYMAHDPRLNLIVYKYLSAIPLATDSITTFARNEIACHVQRFLTLYDHILEPVSAHELAQTDINTQYQSLTLQADDISPLLVNLLRHIIEQHDVLDEQQMMTELTQLWLTMTYSPLVHNIGDLDANITIISSSFYPLTQGFDPSCFTRAHAVDQTQVEFIKGIVSYLAKSQLLKPTQQLSENIRTTSLLCDNNKQQLIRHLLISATQTDSINKRLFNSILLGIRFMTKDLLSLIMLVQNDDSIDARRKLDVCNYLVGYARSDLLARDQRTPSKQDIRRCERHLQQAIGVYKFYYFHNAVCITAQQLKVLLRHYRMRFALDEQAKQEHDALTALHSNFIEHGKTLKLAIDNGIVTDELIDETLATINQTLLEAVSILDLQQADCKPPSVPYRAHQPQYRQTQQAMHEHRAHKHESHEQETRKQETHAQGTHQQGTDEHRHSDEQANQQNENDHSHSHDDQFDDVVTLRGIFENLLTMIQHISPAGDKNEIVQSLRVILADP